MSLRNTGLDEVDGLDHREQKFVENITMGMTRVAATANAGYGGAKSAGYRVANQPHIKAAIQRRHNELRETFRIKREDVLIGLQEAIKDAKLLSDPTAQIAGWREIGRMLGYYEPERKIIEVSDHVPTAIAQLQEVSTTELLELAGPSATIDGEFTLLDSPRAH